MERLQPNIRTMVWFRICSAECISTLLYSLLTFINSPLLFDNVGETAPNRELLIHGQAADGNVQDTSVHVHTVENGGDVQWSGLCQCYLFKAGAACKYLIAQTFDVSTQSDAH